MLEFNFVVIPKIQRIYLSALNTVYFEIEWRAAVVDDA